MRAEMICAYSHFFGAAFVVGVGTLAKPARHFHAETRNDEVFLSELHWREATLFKETVGGESLRIGQHISAARCFDMKV
jgi:hypothetical protein